MIIRKLLINDGSHERELLVVGTIVVGRDPSCQLTDMDPLLSRRHAEFVPTSKGVTIRDLNSRNGILVNGDKVPEYALQPGDVIQLGHLHVRYIEEAVVKSAEDHTRAHATTATGIELPTMAAAPQPAAPPSAAATAPTETAPTPVEASTAHSSIDGDADADRTSVPAARRKTASALPPVASTPASVVDDPDATRVPVAKMATAGEEDPTRAPGMKTAAAVEDQDATRVPAAVRPSDSTVDETRAPTDRSQATAPTRAVRPTEARLVANSGLIVTEATPSCHAVIGARPDTLIGGQLADALSRSVTFVATGDGPSSLSLSIARAPSGRTITITFKAGQATENLS